MGEVSNVEKVISLTPKWAEVLPILFAALESEVPKVRSDARAGLTRMAKVADLYIESLKNDGGSGN